MSSQKGLPKGRKFDCQCATCRERRCLTTVTKIEAMKRRNPTASSTLEGVLAAEVSSLLLPAPKASPVAKMTIRRSATGYTPTAPERLVSDTKRSGYRTVVDDCKMHHIEFFRHGGKTAVNNLLPLCEKHHHLVSRRWPTPERTFRRDNHLDATQTRRRLG